MRNYLVSSNYATQSYLKLFVLIVLKAEIEQIENYTNITTVKSMFLEFFVVDTCTSYLMPRILKKKILWKNLY